MSGIACRFDGCGRPINVVRDQLCQTHYKQQLSGLPLTEIMPRGKRAAQPHEACAFEPCQRFARAKGFCNTHYLQHYHGRPLRMTKAPVPITSRDEQGRKWCGTCETWRPEADFAKSNGKGDGLQTRCRPCNAAIYRSRADEIRDKMREQRLNITREAFDARFAAQGNVCAICGTDEPGKSYWCVDHDHACCPEAGISCGQCIRGILCGLCNAGIGYLRDNVSVVRAAADYLDAWSTVRRVA